jgi:AraC family transcriptional regulator
MQQPGIPLEPPRIVRGEALRIVGLAQRYAGTNAGIPAQWGRFNETGPIPGQLGQVAYGVVHEFDDEGFSYLCGVAVKEFPARQDGLARLELPARSYAVWPHREHVSSVFSTCQRIFEQGLASARLDPEPAPWFERYGEEFDARTGNGGLEIWVPIRG